jgi:hypothetical protein
MEEGLGSTLVMNEGFRGERFSIDRGWKLEPGFYYRVVSKTRDSRGGPNQDSINVVRRKSNEVAKMETNVEKRRQTIYMQRRRTMKNMQKTTARIGKGRAEFLQQHRACSGFAVFSSAPKQGRSAAALRQGLPKGWRRNQVQPSPDLFGQNWQAMAIQHSGPANSCPLFETRNSRPVEHNPNEMQGRLVLFLNCRTLDCEVCNCVF